MRRILLAVAVGLGAGFIPSAAVATPYIITQCDESTCYVFQCTEYPAGNPWYSPGCSVIDMYPRPREVSGD